MLFALVVINKHANMLALRSLDHQVCELSPWHLAVEELKLEHWQWPRYLLKWRLSQHNASLKHCCDEWPRINTHDVDSPIVSVRYALPCHERSFLPFMWKLITTLWYSLPPQPWLRSRNEMMYAFLNEGLCSHKPFQQPFRARYWSLSSFWGPDILCEYLEGLSFIVQIVCWQGCPVSTGLKP